MANKYYLANKDKFKARAAAYYKANTAYHKKYYLDKKRQRKIDAINYLGGVCNKCKGTFDPVIYDFHHIDPTTKEKDPSQILLRKWDRLVKELDKCVLLCANCHRLEHKEY